MATPTYAQVIALINQYIITNGNNEITANILNPVLQFITNFANNTIGDLDDLTTDQQDDIVSAINSIKQNFDDLVNKGIQLHTGINNPNIIPPSSYNYADFYMQLDIDQNPVYLWQWNGLEWTTDMIIPEIVGVNMIDFARLTVAQQNFNIPVNAIAIWAEVNGTTYYKQTANNASEFNTFTQSGNVVSFKSFLDINEYPVIFYQ